MVKVIFLVDGEMHTESLHFTSNLFSSLGCQIVLSKETSVESTIIEVYSTAQKTEGVNIVSALRRLYSGPVSSRLPEFLSLKLSQLPQHSNTSQRLALCLKTLISTAANESCIFVFASAFETLPQTLGIIESAALKMIKIEFVLVHPQSTSPPPASSLSLSASLTWKTDAGAAVPLDPKAAAFISLVSGTLNAKVKVILADDLSKERLAMTLTQQILGLGPLSSAPMRVTLSHPSSLLAPLKLILRSQLKRVALPSYAPVRSYSPVATSDETVQIGASCCLSVPFSSLKAKDQGPLRARVKMDLTIQGLVSRSSVNESLLFGWPHILLPDDLSSDLLYDPEGGARNRRGLRALVQVANEAQALVLASSEYDTDTRKETLGCRIWYLLSPSAPPPPPPRPSSSSSQRGGGEGEVQEGGQGVLLIRKVACRSMLLPLQASPDDSESSQLSLLSQEEMETTRAALSEVLPFDPLNLDDGSEGVVMNLARNSIKKTPSSAPLPPPSAAVAVGPAALAAIPSGSKPGGVGGAGGRSGGQAKLHLDPVVQNKEARKKG